MTPLFYGDSNYAFGKRQDQVQEESANWQQELRDHYHYHGDRLEGQCAIVTGANSGIGEGIARHLAAAGARVCINYLHRDEDTEKIIKEIEATGGSAIGVKADVSQEDAVVEMFQEVRRQFGKLDIMINNAGLQRDAPIAEMTLEQWNKVIEVNMTGSFLCAREAVKMFREKPEEENRSCAKGKIVFISSVHEIIPWAGRANYAASKGGVMLLMRSIAQELGHEKIRVNSISPGAIATKINKPAWKTQEARDQLLELIPYGRIGIVDDIGRGAVYLCSDDSDYVHGVSLVIDGGMTLYPSFREGG
ncbi:MAG: glucose 1-dehydrogenase [Fimbriimonadaceae bacterium]